MKPFVKYLGIAATALALTGFVAAEDTPRNNTASSDQLVAATAELQHELDAKTAKQGDAVTAKLSQSVHFTGTTLPRNTLLLGHIDTVEASQNKGASKIVLTFDQARLADGKQVAVKSTVVGFYQAGSQQVLPSLSPDMQINQRPSGSHGAGLISSVTDSNSGTLSANGSNVHLSKGTELQFALTSGAGSSSSTGN
jgi:hypothetical protein